MYAALLLLLTPVSQAQQVTSTGSCPGNATFTVTDMTPNATFALVSGDGPSVPASPNVELVPVGNCAGLPTAVQGLTLRTTPIADPAGSHSMTANVPVGLCDHLVQAIDLTTCAMSPVTLIEHSATVDPSAAANTSTKLSSTR